MEPNSSSKRSNAHTYTATMGYTLDLTQKLTVMKNIWHLSRIDGQTTPLGTIEQARMKLKE